MGDSNRITVIRTKHNSQSAYFCMSTAAVQDETLSWEARGVLAYLLSKPSDWKVLITDLKQKCGKDKVYRILKELEDAHYLRKEQRRRADMTFEPIEYRVYESPSLYEPLPENPVTEKPEAEFPFPARPVAAFPLPEKPEALLSNEKLSIDSHKVKTNKTTHTPKTNLEKHRRAILELMRVDEYDSQMVKPEDLSPSEKNKYIRIAQELTSIHVSAEEIPALHKLVVGIANSERWSVKVKSTTLLKHSGKYLQQRARKAQVTPLPVVTPADAPPDNGDYVDRATIVSDLKNRKGA